MSVIALILALVSVISILVAVAYYGQMRYYRALFAKEKKQRKQYYKTVFDQAKRIVDIKNSNSSTITTLIKIEAMREVSFRNQIEELEERVEDQLTIISGQDDQIRELKHTIDGLEKLILMKDEEINELEQSSPVTLKINVHTLRDTLIQKCKLIETLRDTVIQKCKQVKSLRGEIVNMKELLRLADEANIGHVKQIHQLQAEKAKVAKELLECRSYVMAYDPILSDGMDQHIIQIFPDGLVAKWIKMELADGQIVAEEPTASPEPCTEMCTKPADKSA